ncbi:MAG: hypothetical protein GY861_12765 [bacterium]|nr:hypothetical protein [bacterium]
MIFAEPNSHYWTNIDMMINFIKYAPELNKEEIISGLENTKANGYDLRKRNEKFIYEDVSD